MPQAMQLFMASAQLRGVLASKSHTFIVADVFPPSPDRVVYINELEDSTDRPTGRRQRMIIAMVVPRLHAMRHDRMREYDVTCIPDPQQYYIE